MHSFAYGYQEREIALLAAISLAQAQTNERQGGGASGSEHSMGARGGESARGAWPEWRLQPASRKVDRAGRLFRTSKGTSQLRNRAEQGGAQKGRTAEERGEGSAGQHQGKSTEEQAERNAGDK